MDTATVATIHVTDTVTAATIHVTDTVTAAIQVTATAATTTTTHTRDDTRDDTFDATRGVGISSRCSLPRSRSECNHYGSAHLRYSPART